MRPLFVPRPRPGSGGGGRPGAYGQGYGEGLRFLACICTQCRLRRPPVLGRDQLAGERYPSAVRVERDLAWVDGEAVTPHDVKADLVHVRMWVCMHVSCMYARMHACTCAAPRGIIAHLDREAAVRVDFVNALDRDSVDVEVELIGRNEASHL